MIVSRETIYFTLAKATVSRETINHGAFENVSRETVKVLLKSAYIKYDADKWR